MKKLAITLVWIVAGSCGSAFAQITITAADVNAKLAVGNTIVNVTDTTTMWANIGVPGLTATSWDFSALQSHGATTLISVAPATTPFIADFPGATHALKTSLAGSFSGFPGTVTGDLYLYLKVATNLDSPGSKGGGTATIPGLGTFPGTLTIANSPADITYALPSTLGTSWTSTYQTTTAIVLSGVQFSSTTVNHDISYAVDGFGTLTLPGGSTHNAIRIRRDDRLPGRSVGYIFLSNDGASVQVTAEDTLQPNLGTIQVRLGSVTWSAAFTTDIREGNDVPGAFSLQQNYPNPFNPGTTIRYQLSSSVDVSLKVFDLLGREVATLVDERKPAGEYRVSFDGTGLASGVYIYKLTAGGLVQSKRMVLLK